MINKVLIDLLANEFPMLEFMCVVDRFDVIAYDIGIPYKGVYLGKLWIDLAAAQVTFYINASLVSVRNPVAYSPMMELVHPEFDIQLLTLVRKLIKRAGGS